MFLRKGKFDFKGEISKYCVSFLSLQIIEVRCDRKEQFNSNNVEMLNKFLHLLFKPKINILLLARCKQLGTKIVQTFILFFQLL